MPEQQSLLLPISAVELPGRNLLDLKAFTVVVGPNSSGKTQLLRDIQAAAIGQARRLVVATKISFADLGELDEFVESAVNAGYLERLVGGNTGDSARYRRRHHQLGTNDGAGQENPHSELKRIHEMSRRAASTPHADELPSNPLLAFLSGAFCASLFLENRLTLLQDTNTFDYEESPASNLLQSLFLSRQAQEVLESELIAAFDRTVWIDYTRGNKLILRAADAEDAPAGDLRRFAEEMRRHRPLSAEGDGLRSYAAVCITLLLSKQPLCLVDEPELCLHPPQAYALGRFIGAHAQEQPRGLIVATHSAHVLRGIIDSRGSPTILRMTRSRAHTFSPRTIDRGELDAAVRNPRARAESVLDGLFTECAVFCEAEGDRVVYEAAYTMLPVRSQGAATGTGRETRDLRFVPVSGLSANTALLKMYRALGIPAASVVDTDLLTNKKELRAIASACGADDDELRSVDKLSGEIILALQTSPPAISVNEFKSQLSALAEREYDWATGDDEDAKRRLSTLKSSLARTRNIKQGLGVLAEPLQRETRAMLGRLEQLGLFIVPVGTLESWIPDLMAGISQSNKAEWAATAADKLRQTPPRPAEDVWAFVSRIDRFARARSEELARQGLTTTPTTVSGAP